jgi:hypothetical protein
MGLTVGAGEIQTLDGKIRNLQTDVKNAADANNPPSVVLLAEMNNFATRWYLWRATHTTVLAQSGIPNIESGWNAGNVGAEFEQFTGEYNEMLRRFIANGGKTTATPATSTESPTEKIGDTVVKVAVAGAALFILWKVLSHD